MTPEMNIPRVKPELSLSYEDKLLNKISVLRVEISKLKARIRSLEAENKRVK